MKKSALFLVVACALFLVWWKWGNSGAPPIPARAALTSGNSSTGTNAVPPSVVLNIDPKLGANSTRAALDPKRGQLPPVVSPLLSEYIARKDFPGLLSKLRQNPDNSEALFLQAQILERCARISDANPKTSPKSPEERRAAFVASLPPGARDTTMRIAAYDTANFDPCGDLRATQTTRGELAELRAKALEMKDPAASARDLNCEVFGSIDRANGGRFPEINDSRFGRIRSAISSRNPIAVRAGVGMLANTYRNGTFRIGPEGKPVDPNVMSYVANLMACQYGGDCQADVLRACANDGKCDVNSYDDFLAYYQLSPNDAQAAEQYRAWLTQMVDGGNFDQLQLIPGEQTMESVRVGSYFSCVN